MATVLEFTSPADEFPLGTVFENLPTVTVELERLVAQETPIIPYFWVRGGTNGDVTVAFSVGENEITVYSYGAVAVAFPERESPEIAIKEAPDNWRPTVQITTGTN